MYRVHGRGVSSLVVEGEKRKVVAGNELSASPGWEMCRGRLMSSRLERLGIRHS